MSANKQLKPEVRINDEFVELKLADGQSMFILAIDDRGLPHFPERMTEKLPSYVTELAQKAIHHRLWCFEIEGFGSCNCADPGTEICLRLASKDVNLFCDVCCSVPCIEKIGWEDTIGKPLKPCWTDDGEGLYWVVGPEPTGAIYCGDCLRDIMEVDFSRMDQLPVKLRPKG